MAATESPDGVSSTAGIGQPLETDAARGDYSFLIDSGLSTAQLLAAVDVARSTGVPVADALAATGVLDDVAYARLVAASLGVAFAAMLEVEAGPPLLRLRHLQVRLVAARAADAKDARSVYALPASGAPPGVLANTIRALAQAGLGAVISTGPIINAAIERAERRRATRHAIHGLRRVAPDLSAAQPPPLWLLVAAAVAIGLFGGGVLIAPAVATAALLLLLTLPFLAVVAVRCVALVMLWRSRPRAMSLDIADADLPVYTVLVPLFDEQAVVPALVQALAGLDYPTAKLDVTLVLEEVDLTTKLALLKQALPHNFNILVVPDSQPRTKPKALNYAMQFARGDFVVVFDAEDRPEPDQLRKAVAAFRNGPGQLGCVQARLNLYNPHDSWWSRQFTVEYSALFDAILPALAVLRLPVPLGGTSNHFPRALLEAIGGWDPFNVTEDADLGIRLARLGYATEILDSTTWEEAPVDWSQWLPQRTRWLKGWYQTYLVHHRRPLLLVRELGIRKTLGLQIFLGGVILSTLVHPLVCLLFVVSAFAGDAAALPALSNSPWLWVASMVTLAVGYGSAALVGFIAGRRREAGLGWSALAMPVYWLLVSAAAYRALWQLWRQPFLWEKTRHGAARSMHERGSPVH